MFSVWIEMRCPKHGLERFRVKVIKRYNLPADVIQPKTRNRPKPGEISCLYTGRSVNEEQVKNYLVNYFRERNMLEAIVKMRLQM